MRTFPIKKMFFHKYPEKLNFQVASSLSIDVRPAIGLIWGMAYGVIPEDIQQFILQHIDSVAQLEGLLMCYTHPQKEWNADLMARGLFIDETQAGLLLAHLAEQGFITASPGYQYQPVSPEKGEMVGRLAELYKQYLVPITNLIHAKPKTRIQKFADAFRIRKD